MVQCSAAAYNQSKQSDLATLGRCSRRYEAAILKVCALFASLLLSISAWGEMGMLEQELDPETAEELGFEVSVTKENDDVMIVFLLGPSEVNGCLPGRSGSFLLGPNGEELMGYLTELPDAAGAPKSFGYSTNLRNQLSVFIDYFCPEGRALESRRYVVQLSRYAS